MPKPTKSEKLAKKIVKELTPIAGIPYGYQILTVKDAIRIVTEILNREEKGTKG
jgi:hypothetical protein